MAPATIQPSFIHLGCTDIADMPGYSECAYVSSSSTPESATLTARAVLPSSLTNSVNGHPQYVNMAIYGSVGILIGIVLSLIVVLLVKRHKKKKGGKK
ncbi:hypothetical protein LTR97_008598 [Elasticomyces elasticus]|uniref:Uncharacterized protein n=1 Tax=Elasticomyces elasticus TaxID=574655 RepID=A0AAN7ZZC1_9PEZI|nr:hypothetical protein LTR97_008598 [Elasticomyces elasticus]